MISIQSLAPSLKRRFKKLFSSDVEIVWVPVSNIDCIVGELAWVEDVIFEMAVRAAAAMPFGGRLIVNCADVCVDNATAASDGMPAGRYAMFEMTCLRERVTGVSEAKFEGRTACSDAWLHCDIHRAQALIRCYGGELREYNEPGGALTIRAFFVTLYPSSIVAQELLMTNGRLEPPKILLVEDEGYVRDAACEILESAGYQVITASTGAEAVNLFEQSGPVQLLLTDVVMPGMNGHQLAPHSPLSPRS